MIDVHSNLQPDPNEQSATLLRAILLTLNQSAIPGETPTVPPIQAGPASEIVLTTCLIYASLLISLLAAFIAMLGKQWLNRYLRHSGGSMIERCGDRQRKCNGLKKWPLHFFIESLPVMLQVALLLLACGLCRYMWSINSSVAYTLICLTGLGVVFFIGIVVAGMSSYACPFQTPISTALRGTPKKIRRGVKRAFSRIQKSWNRSVRPILCRPSLPTTTSLSGIEIQETKPWLEREDLATIHATHTNDAQCVSWIIRNITDPEALEAAVRLAGTIRWFDGPDVDVPYDSIVSTFEGCFDPSGKLYPGSRDRAYYSGRAMVWIHGLAMCKSEEFARTFPLSSAKLEETGLDPDLRHIICVNQGFCSDGGRVVLLLETHPEHTCSHTRWVSDALLHYSWATRSKLIYGGIPGLVSNRRETKIAIPLDATLNRLLAWCIFLGSPPAEEALVARNKSYDTSCFALQITHGIPHQRLPGTNPKPIVQSCPFGSQRPLVSTSVHPARVMRLGQAGNPAPVPDGDCVWVVLRNIREPRKF